MADFMTDSWLRVWDASGDGFSVEMSDEPRINAAVSAWVDSGRTKDRLLDLSCVNGTTFWILASDIRAWCASTPESRREDVRHRIAYDEEDKRINAEFGVFDAD